MDLSVNGQLRQVPSNTTLTQLLSRLELGGDGVAVAINHIVVPKSEHPITGLSPGDSVEIIHAVGGG
jgi:thiamine biosynthesis protein ThiS